MPDVATADLSPARYLSIEELAALLRLTPKSITRWIDEGLLPRPVHRGRAGKRLFNRAQVLAALEKLEGHRDV